MSKKGINISKHANLVTDDIFLDDRGYAQKSPVKLQDGDIVYYDDDEIKSVERNGDEVYKSDTAV